MDPDVALAELRRLAERVLDRESTEEEIVTDARELAHKARELDEWINSGGFLPADWQRNQGE